MNGSKGRPDRASQNRSRMRKFLRIMGEITIRQPHVSTSDRLHLGSDAATDAMALLREAIAQFLNPSAGEPVNVRAIVIDLVACDLEIHARGPRVRRNASPEIIRDFVVRDR